jgi:hypothetical protein
MSELWMRPEEHHIHASNHAMGPALDTREYRWVVRSHVRRMADGSTIRVGAEARALMELLPFKVARELAGAPAEAAPLAVWGGRKGSIQLGSDQDRRRVRRRAAVAIAERAFRGAQRDRCIVPSWSTTQLALRDLGRELDLIWA